MSIPRTDFITLITAAVEEIQNIEVLLSRALAISYSIYYVVFVVCKPEFSMKLAKLNKEKRIKILKTLQKSIQVMILTCIVSGTMSLNSINYIRKIVKVKILPFTSGQILMKLCAVSELQETLMQGCKINILSDQSNQGLIMVTSVKPQIKVMKNFIKKHQLKMMRWMLWFVSMNFQIMRILFQLASKVLPMKMANSPL